MVRISHTERALSQLQGARLREARTRAGLSLEQLGEQLGLSPSTVSSYELGGTVIRAHLARRLVPLVKRSAAYLLGVEDGEACGPVRVIPRGHPDVAVLTEAAGALGFDFRVEGRDGQLQFYLQPRPRADCADRA